MLPHQESSSETGSLNILTAMGVLNPALPVTELHLADGRKVRIDTALLEGTSAAQEPAAEDSRGGAVIPLIEERLEVTKRTVETEFVRLHKSVQEFETALDETLAVRSYDIERVILNQPVESAPPVRTEGDTTIYPLVEEQLVLTKHLVLREEVRVTRRDSERQDTRTVVLRREHLIVERQPLT